MTAAELVAKQERQLRIQAWLEVERRANRRDRDFRHGNNKQPPPRLRASCKMPCNRIKPRSRKKQANPRDELPVMSGADVRRPSHLRNRATRGVRRPRKYTRPTHQRHQCQQPSALAGLLVTATAILAAAVVVQYLGA